MEEGDGLSDCPKGFCPACDPDVYYGRGTVLVDLPPVFMTAGRYACSRCGEWSEYDRASFLCVECYHEGRRC